MDIKVCPCCGEKPEAEIGYNKIEFAKIGMQMWHFYTLVCSCEAISKRSITLFSYDGQIKKIKDGYAECVSAWNERCDNIENEQLTQKEKDQ